MAPPEFIDFDAARAERVAEALLTVKVGGRRIDIPRPPADAVFDMLRVQRDQAILKDLPARDQSAKVLAIFEGLFGSALVELGKAGATNAELNELAGRVCAAAMAEAQPAPNRKTRRAAKPRSRSTSSRGGRCSRRTSSANTGSTSASI